MPSLTSSRPAIIRSSVDFPHPEGPTAPELAVCDLESMASTARTPPSNTLVTCRAGPRPSGGRLQQDLRGCVGRIGQPRECCRPVGQRHHLDPLRGQAVGGQQREGPANSARVYANCPARGCCDARDPPPACRRRPAPSPPPRPRRRRASRRWRAATWPRRRRRRQRDRRPAPRPPPPPRAAGSAEAHRPVAASLHRLHGHDLGPLPGARCTLSSPMGPQPTTSTRLSLRAARPPALPRTRPEARPARPGCRSARRVPRAGSRGAPRHGRRTRPGGGGRAAGGWRTGSRAPRRHAAQVPHTVSGNTDQRPGRPVTVPTTS